MCLICQININLKMLFKIVTGGQTGVDRAALDVCLELKFPYSGYCPKGRIAEDGVIDEKYKLKETESSLYSERTRKNIEISDGTLIFLPCVKEIPLDGTKLTIEILKKVKKPFLFISREEGSILEKSIGWLEANNIQVLNIAGPRASQDRLAYSFTKKILKKLLTQYL